MTDASGLYMVLMWYKLVSKVGKSRFKHFRRRPCPRILLVVCYVATQCLKTWNTMELFFIYERQTLSLTRVRF